MTIPTEAEIRAADAMVNYDGPEVNPAVWHRRELLRLLDEARDNHERTQYALDNASRDLGDLLAVIHGDGGHYKAEHGTQKAVEDAVTKWAALVLERDEARAMEKLGDDLADQYAAKLSQVRGEASRLMVERDAARAQAEASRRDAERWRYCDEREGDYCIARIEIIDGYGDCTLHVAHDDGTIIDKRIAAMQEPGRD